MIVKHGGIADTNGHVSVFDTEGRMILKTTARVRSRTVGDKIVIDLVGDITVKAPRRCIAYRVQVMDDNGLLTNHDLGSQVLLKRGETFTLGDENE